MIMRKLIKICVVFCVALGLFSSCETSEVTVPSIILENEGLLSVSFEATEVSMAYSIDKPVEGAVLTVEVPEDNSWLEVEVSDMSINFSITENQEQDSRSEMMTVRYTYGDKSVKNYITVNQASSEYEKVYDANFGGCIWYGNVYSTDPNLTKYNVMLETEDGIIACLDLNAPVDTEDMLPPAGEYKGYEYRLEEGYSLSTGPYSTTYICQYFDDSNTPDYIAIGALESHVSITRDGDVYTIKASIVDDRTGRAYMVRYTGKMEVDNGLVESTLTSDIDKKYDAAALGLTAEYGVYDTGASSNYWIIYIMGEEMSVGQPVVYLELVTASDVMTPASLAGTYTVGGADWTPGTFLPGSYGYDGTWYLEVSALAGGQAYAEIQAPITAGTVNVGVNADGTLNITLDGVDDHDTNPHKVKVVLDNVKFVSPAL